MKRYQRPLVLVVSATLVVIATLVSVLHLQAANPNQHELEAVWHRVQRSGSYTFNADMTQTKSPQATVINAGRKGTQNALYLEGETDINAESLHLLLWSEGGSVQIPGSGTEILVEGDRAQARQGSGPWEEIDDFTALFAPGGDFLAYTQAAKNVVRHVPEMHSTPLGTVEVTRYTFHIDGRSFAIGMHEQMREQALREGLPGSVRLDLPRVYAEMTGTGELWVGDDGLPLRQHFALEFPPDQEKYITSAQVTVDFSNFAPLSIASSSSHLAHRLWGSVQGTTQPGNVLSLLSAVMALWLVTLVVLRRRSSVVHAVVAVLVILSMLVTPLLTTRRVVAYSDRQDEKQAAHDEQVAAQEAQDALSEQMRSVAMNPHADPLAAARAAGRAAVAAPMVQSSNSRYFDPSCESDPTGDMDGDGLTNLSECLVGTLPGVADTDSDGVTDAEEVTGFSYQDQTWYSDPLNADSNYDGIGDGKEWHLTAHGQAAPLDTDGDGTPDLWDDDNDGDGVRDGLDLSPYATTKTAEPFSGSKPFELAIDNLIESELVRVEFQLRPTDADHLWYSQSVLDWPQGDQQAQIQDADGKTFADVDPTLPAWPNANGDMRLIPMLEIAMDAETANLPSPNILSQFGISVQQTDDETQTAYVPVQLVSDDTGDANVGFYARMFYQATADWGNPHQVRLVWTVQMLNDLCGYPDTPPADFTYGAEYWPPDPTILPSNWDAGKDGGDWPGNFSLFQDGLCQFYSAMNQPQVVQTYDDAWYFTGLHVMEEHSADIAMIYEDPQQTPTIEPGADDTPFYMDTLYGLLYGLDTSFLAGRDCDSTDSNGDCVGNGELDITVDTIGDRFNHATNSYDANAPAYWGLPNVLNVVKNGVQRTAGDGLNAYADIAAYESMDLAMMDTTITGTVGVLETHFTDLWSESDPITPTIMLAYQQTYRDLNLDTVINQDPNIDWSGSSLTLHMPQDASSAPLIDTTASVQWTPYRYDPATGWAPANLQGFWYAMNAELASSFADISDSDEAQTEQTMAQSIYLATAGGLSSIVQLNNAIVTPTYQQPDEPYFLSDINTVGGIVQKAVNNYYTYSENLQELAANIQYHIDVLDESVVTATSRGFQQTAWDFISEFSRTKLQIGVAIGIIVGAVLVFGLIVKYLVHNPSNGLALVGKLSVGIPLAAISLYNNIIKPIMTIYKTAATAVENGATWAEATGNILAESSTITIVGKAANVIGLVLAIGIAVGMFAYAWASGAVSPGTIAFNGLIAQTIAAIIIALVLFVLSLSIIGSILVSILALVDTILLLAGSNFTITGWFTKAIASVIYQYDLDTSQDVTSGQFSTTLTDPDGGMIAGNGLNQTLPLTTTLQQSYPESTGRLKSNSLIYELSVAVEELSTATGDRTDDWAVSQYDTYYESDGNGAAYSEPLYQAVAADQLTLQTTLSAGVNTSVPLWLNSAYALRGSSCWVGFCSSKTIAGNSSDSLGNIVVLDVLPATLSEFVDVNAWGTVGFLDADGDGMLPNSEGGLDPDDSTWDLDADRLSDAYEVNTHSLPADQGGTALNPAQSDSDGDGLSDYAEMRNGTAPDSSDSDGDGLVDLQEARLIINDDGKLVLNSGSGWLIAYAYDADNSTASQTRVWSDPAQADADSDGMSDLFEEAQTTLESAPWADPTNPLVYNPNVWNESPVTIYLDDDSTDGFVKPGATLVYTATTANNLSSGQELVGKLSLDLPDGVSGGPISQNVDINSGERGSLISTLTFDHSGSAAYEFASTMELTDYDQTRWAWDAAVESTRDALGGTPSAIAVASVEGWDVPFVMVTAERTNTALTINGYTVEADGTVLDATTLYTSAAVGGRLTAPDIACNEEGACLVVWGEVNSTGAAIDSVRLANGLHSPSSIQLTTGFPVTAPAVATNGTGFMVAWGQYTQPNGGEVAYQMVPISQMGERENGSTLAQVNSEQGAIALDWTGSGYLAVYAEDGNLHRVDTDAAGVPTSQSSIDVGGGWPQGGGNVHAPALGYDPISNGSLLVYRDAAGSMVARVLTASSSGEALPLVESGVDGNDVTVALSPDSKNSGWVLAWGTGGTVEYRALSPTGGLRGNIEQAEQSALTAVALSCIVPQPELDLALDEATGATVFSDSSPHDRPVTCDESGMQCPQAGFTGKSGNAASFDGDKTALVVPDGINLDNRSHSLAAWVNRSDAAQQSTVILSQASEPYVTNQDVLFSIQGSDHVACGFRNNLTITKQSYDHTGWHHWVCTYDLGNDQHLIYRDGVAVPAEHTGSSTGPYTGSGPLYIGRFVDGTSPFNGLLQDVQVYDRVLTAAEIQDVFDQPIGVFDLDETRDSNRFVNSADTGFNGECSGDTCPTLGVPGVAYTAAQFDGNDSIVITPTAEVDHTYQWTFENHNTTNWAYWDGNTPATSIQTATRNGSATKYLDAEADTHGGLELQLTELPAHDRMDISFDLYVLGNEWLGTNVYSGSSLPTFWLYANLNNFQWLARTTFSNESSSKAGAYQLYPYVANNYWASWSGKDTILYENSNCASQPSQAFDTDYIGIPSGTNGTSYLTDVTSDFTFNVKCVETDQEVVAVLYENTNFSGSSYLQDPKRNNTHQPNNKRIRSVAVGPAAHPPKHGSTGETLVLKNGSSDNAVYSLSATMEDSHSSQHIAFESAEAFGVDNVKVELIKDANSFPLRNSSFTLSAWARRDVADQFGMLIAQGTATQNQGLHFGFRDSNVFTCGFYSDDLTTVDTYTDTDWHHWACTYDDTTKTRTIYLDGTAVISDTAAAHYQGFGATYIGQRFDDKDYFTGAIDEIGIWTEALSAIEVQELYSKVKVEDESVLVCQLPVATESAELALDSLTLRETTTRIGDVSQTVTRTISVDNDTPTVEIQTLRHGQYVSGDGTVSVGGSATDSSSYIAGVQVQSDNDSSTLVEVSGKGAWAYAWDPSGENEGTHTIQVQAFDAVGNQSDSQSVEFLLDRTPPSVSLGGHIEQPTQDKSGRWYVPLRGSVNDPNAGNGSGSGTMSVEVLLQGQQEASGNGWQSATLSGGSWTLAYRLPRIGDDGQGIIDPSGIYTATVRATDAVSNTTPIDSYPVSLVTLDVAGPTLAVNQPISRTRVISTGLTAGGSVSDLSAIAAVEVSLTPAEQIDALNGNVLHLPMDENRASEYFNDQSGTNHNATCSGIHCPTVGQSGQRDGAFAFDGSDDYLTVDGVDLSHQSFTLAAWVKRNASGRQDFIISQGTASNLKAIDMGYIASDHLRCSPWGQQVDSAEAYTDNQWHHVACTYNATDGTMTLYRDGIQVGQAAVGAYTGQGTLYIGQRFDGVRQLNGFLDEVLIYNRALADYEVANLYAYGQGTWEAATLNNGIWSYTIPEGDNGIEGIYQINVRGTDVLSNSTPLRGQSAWRGEIDTRSPDVQFIVTTDDSGSTPSTTYECIASDFNLLQESDRNGYQTASCVPYSPDGPFFRNSGITLINYASVNDWYAATITDTGRLYNMDAVSIESGEPVSNPEVVACDIYNHCTTAAPSGRIAAPLAAAGAEVLSPASGTVLTSTEPITVTGDVYAKTGLQVLTVLVNGNMVRTWEWETDDVTSEPWSFTWTPPGEGIYRFEPLVDGWAGQTPPAGGTRAQMEPTDADRDATGKEATPEQVAGPPAHLEQHIHLPFVVVDASSTGGLSSDGRIFLPFVATEGEPVSGTFTGTVSTIFVDLTPPEVTLETTAFTREDDLGRGVFQLAGAASDSVWLYRVDVRIDDGPWQRAGVNGSGVNSTWQFPWRVGFVPEDATYQVSVRATDLAGRTAITTELVTLVVEVP